jgi:hypothetical protein
MPISPPATDEREWQTRKKRIDTRLAALGWSVVRFDPARPLSHYDAHAWEYKQKGNCKDLGEA